MGCGYDLPLLDAQEVDEEHAWQCEQWVSNVMSNDYNMQQLVALFSEMIMTQADQDANSKDALGSYHVFRAVAMKTAYALRTKLISAINGYVKELKQCAREDDGHAWYAYDRMQTIRKVFVVEINMNSYDFFPYLYKDEQSRAREIAIAMQRRLCEKVQKRAQEVMDCQEAEGGGTSGAKK